jgi:Family of unknown function (DUF6152)
MRFERFAVIIGLALAILALSGGALWAHHSVAGYDTQKVISVPGVIKEFNWRNPHVYVVWDAKDESGKVVEWAGELSSPTTMIQQGMNRNSLKPGDEVIVWLHPSKTSNPLGVIQKISMANGKIVVDKVPAN